MAAHQPSPDCAAHPIMPLVPLPHLLLVAVAAASIAGLIFTLLQQWLLVPAILRAEAVTAGSQAGPESGTVRMLATAMFNWLAAFGYGLLLAVAMFVRRDRGWRRGLAWGAAGWLSFALAPSLGLPPELPGGAELALVARQSWWVYSTAGAAVGLALLVFGRGSSWRIAGAVLAIVPHLVGAPGPGWQGLPWDARAFAVATLAVGAGFWLSLGAATGALLTRMRRL